MSNRNLLTIGVTLLASALMVLIAALRSGPANRAQEVVSSAVADPTSFMFALPPPREVPSSRAVRADALPARVAEPEPAVVLNEAQLMENLRHARTLVIAIRLAREGNRLFPDSDFAPERESILIHSLADNEQRSEARGEAEYMVNHYPDSAWVREIEQFTGAHRHRHARLTEAGVLELD